MQDSRACWQVLACVWCDRCGMCCSQIEIAPSLVPPLYHHRRRIDSGRCHGQYHSSRHIAGNAKVESSDHCVTRMHQRMISGESATIHNTCDSCVIQGSTQNRYRRVQCSVRVNGHIARAPSAVTSSAHHSAALFVQPPHHARPNRSSLTRVDSIIPR